MKHGVAAANSVVLNWSGAARKKTPGQTRRPDSLMPEQNVMRLDTT
jgi:hypothetical protein